MPNWRHAWFVVVAATMFLQACGGGSSTPSNTNSNTVNPSVTTSALRVRVQSDSGVPVAFASVSWGGQQVTTNAQGVLEFDGSPAAGDVVNVTSAGYEPGIMRLAAAQEDVVVVLTTRATTATLDVATGGTVQVSGSVAQVNLPANGLVLNGTTTAATGKATVSITPIDPSADSSAMPGSYLLQTSAGAVPIESFGAIRVSLENAAGQRLNLAAGKKATIRIPLASRSSAPPATIPLLYLDEATGLWQEEGSATLKGTAPNQYYEGDVAHFTVWNADQPLETVWVDGCLVDDKNQAVANAQLLSDGLDYSGQSSTTTDAQGRFRVAMRKSSVATLSLPSSTKQYLNEQVGNYTRNSSLTTCLVAKDIPAQVAILQQPTLKSLGYGRYVASALATGPGAVRYQWMVNGVDVPWAQSSRFYFTSTDYVAGDKMQVRVSNGTSSVTSVAVVFSPAVSDLIAPVLLSVPSPISSMLNTSLSIKADVAGSAPLSYQWLRDGQPIAGATGADITVSNVALTTAGNYQVRVSNAKGTVTSTSWVVSVASPNNDTSGGPLILQLAQSAFFVSLPSPTMVNILDVIDYGDGKLGNVCSTGSATGTLDGQTTFTTPEPNKQHSLIANFDHCYAPDMEASFNDGKLESAFSYSGDLASGFSENAKLTLTNFAHQQEGLVHNGSVTIATSSSDVNGVLTYKKTFTPFSGASVADLAKLSGSTFDGTGNIVVLAELSETSSNNIVTKTVGTTQYNNLSFTKNRKTYVANGALTTTMQISGTTGIPLSATISGEIVLKTDGEIIARVYGDAAGQMVFEVAGVTMSITELIGL